MSVIILFLNFMFVQFLFNMEGLVVFVVFGFVEEILMGVGQMNYIGVIF